MNWIDDKKIEKNNQPNDDNIFEKDLSFYVNQFENRLVK